MSNSLKFYLRNALYGTSLYLVTGSIIQAFLSECGLNAGQIGLYVSMVNGVGIAVFILFSGLPDRVKRIRRMLTTCIALATVGCLLYIPFCFFHGGGDAVVVLLFLLGAAQYLAMSLKNLLEYKLPYFIIPMETYAHLVTVDGVVTGVVGILPGIILTAVLRGNPYFPVMTVVFLSAAVLMGASAAVNARFTMLTPKTADPGPESKKSLKVGEVLRLPLFRALILPNLLRGIMMGTASIAAVIGLSEAGFTGASSAIIPVTATAANISGSLIYMGLSRRMKAPALCLVGGLLTAFFPLCCLGGEVLFLVVYFLVTLGIMVISYSVLYIVYHIIPFEIAGAYNTWRMVITNSAWALASAVGGQLIGRIPAWTFLTVVAVCSLVSSGMFYTFSKKNLRPGKEAVSASL